MLFHLFLYVHLFYPGLEPETSFDLVSRFRQFEPIHKEWRYSITLCADIPDNSNPDRLHVKDETGHVFLILAKYKPSRDTIFQVFGFYPVRPASTILFKNVDSELLDNGGKEYNASVTMNLSAMQFVKLLDFCRARKTKYNLNKYNCYDYAVEVFNSIEGIQKIPVHHVKFPFILGSGGAPGGLYKDLQYLKLNRSAWSENIFFGIRKAPYSRQ